MCGGGALTKEASIRATSYKIRKDGVYSVINSFMANDWFVLAVQILQENRSHPNSKHPEYPRIHSKHSLSMLISD